MGDVACREVCFVSSFADTEDMPRHHPPVPTVTTSGPTVTQQQSSHGVSRQRLPVEKAGQSGKTVTVKAVCRSDLQGQKGGAGTTYTAIT